jgi:hypothetical protein
LADKKVAPKLSHQRHGFFFSFTPSSLRRASTHINSVVAFARDLYSTLVLDLDTVACFLALQETKFGPTNIAKPPVDLLSSRQPAQSVSEKALRYIEGDFIKVIPVFTVSFTYLKIHLMAIQCSVVGVWRY